MPQLVAGRIHQTHESESGTAGLFEETHRRPVRRERPHSGRWGRTFDAHREDLARPHRADHAREAFDREYDDLLARLSIEPPVRTFYAPGEKLLDQFERNSFDLAYASNALDHSLNLLLAIEQMFAVVKPAHLFICGTSPTNASRKATLACTNGV